MIMFLCGVAMKAGHGSIIFSYMLEVVCVECVCDVCVVYNVRFFQRNSSFGGCDGVEMPRSFSVLLVLASTGGCEI